MGHWEEKRQEYKTSDWSDNPTLFAQSIVDYFPSQGKLLDLGAGLGQDSVFFAERGYEVVSTDINLDTKLNMPEDVARIKVDLREKLPFEDKIFDIVYAHLSLHYFDLETTERLFKEIRRVLKVGGIVAFLVNSVDDPEYGTGKKIEEDYFDTEGTTKRFFDPESAQKFAGDFEKLLCDNKGESYKDRAKGVHSLVRFVGRKHQ